MRWPEHGYEEKNLKWETESILIAAQNNTLKANYIKDENDSFRENSKGRLCGDRDETVWPIISDCC